MSAAQSIAHRAYTVFHQTMIPTNPGVTFACLDAGAAVATLARSHGVPTTGGFRREDVHWGVEARQRMRAVNAQLVAELETLPNTPNRQAAIEKLNAYSEALTSCN